MKINAIKVNQNGHELYFATMPVSFITDSKKVDVDTWSKDNTSGYQRNPVESRSRQFAAYIEKAKGVSPNSVLLSIRKDVEFKPIDKNSKLGVLEIPDNEKIWVIDGQHRIKGFSLLADKGTFLDFEIPAVIFPLHEKFEEAKQFVIINRTQKGVKADLAERFLLELSEKEGIETLKDMPNVVTKGIEWKPNAITIADSLNEADPVWKGKIQLPNEPRKGTLVSQKSFTDSLEPVLNSSLFINYNSIEVKEMLSRYWQALKEIMPEVFDIPGDYVLQRTTGVFVMNRFFPLVASYCINGNNAFTVSRLSEILAKIDELKPEFWSNDGIAGMAGTSQKSFSLLFNKLKRSLEDNIELKDQKPIRPFQL